MILFSHAPNTTKKKDIEVLDMSSANIAYKYDFSLIKQHQSESWSCQERK